MRSRKGRTVYLFHAWPPATKKSSRPAEKKEEKPEILEFLKLPLVVTIVTGLVGLFTAWINHQYQTRLQAVEIHATKERTRAEIEATQIRAISELVLAEHRPKTAGDHVLFIGTLTSFGKYSIPTLLSFMGKEFSGDEVGAEGTVDEAMERAMLSLVQVFDHPTEVADAMGAVLGARTGAFNYRAHQTAIRVILNMRDLDSGMMRMLLQGYRPDKTIDDWKDVEGNDDNAISFCCPLKTLREQLKVDSPQGDGCNRRLDTLAKEKGISCP